MKIEKTENLDLLFKQKLNELPISFNEAHWDALETKLNQSLPLSTASSNTSWFSLKTILLLLAVGLGTVGAISWFLNENNQSNKTVDPIVKSIVNTTQNDSLSINSNSQPLIKVKNNEKRNPSSNQLLIKNIVTDSIDILLPHEKELLLEEDTTTYFFW